MLEKGLALAKGPREEEFADALRDCVPKVFVSPTTATLQTGGTVTFTATSNTGETAFQWSTSGGSVTQSGVYTAPGTASAQTVTAALPSDPTRRASATVTVVTSATQVTGGSRQLTSIAVAGCSGTGVVTTDDDTLNRPASGSSTLDPISSASVACSPSTASATVHPHLESRMQVDGAGTVDIRAIGSTFPDTGRSSSNSGGTGGVWMVIGASVSADFQLASAYSADCSGSFNFRFLDPVTRSLKITNASSTTVVDVNPSSTHVTTGLPAGSYHVEAAGKYQGASVVAAGGASFSLTCTLSPA